MKKYILVLFLITFIVPLITFAGTAYTDFAGITHYSDGSTSYKDFAGITHYSNGGTASTDFAGITHYNNIAGGISGTASTDFAGTTHLNLNNGTNGTARTDFAGITHINLNNGISGTASTDFAGTTHFNGDVFLSNNCPQNSTYDSLSRNCKCNSGYVVSGSSCVYESYTPTYTPTYIPTYIPTYSPTVSSCPINSYLSSGSCYCSAGYKLNSDKTGCIIKPVKTENQSCQDTYGINSYSPSSGKCRCDTGYEWATDRKSCVKSISLTTNNANTGSAPTCSILVVPQEVEIGQLVTLIFRTTGVIEGYNGRGTGDMTFKLFKDYDAFLASLKTGTYSIKIKTSKIGLASQTGTVNGPGGSSTCTGSYTVISKSTSSVGSIEKKEEPKTDGEIIPIIEQKNEADIKTPEPAKEVKWYQKIFNWFK